MEKIKGILNSKIFYVILVFVSAIYISIFFNIPKESELDGEETNFEGELIFLKITSEKASFKIKLDKENLVCNYYFKDGESLEYEDYELGSIVKVEGKLNVPSNNTVPNTFNYKKYLYRNSTFYTCTIKAISVIKEANVFYKVKNVIIKRIMSFEIKDYMLALLVGDKSLLDDEVYSTYQKNGVAHLLAISGMHIGFFSMILLWIGKQLNIGKKSRYLVVTSILWFYAFLVGFTPSVKRACLLFTFGSINKVAKLEMSPFKIFLLVLCAIIDFNPLVMGDTGFLYSFVIAGGLIMSQPYLKKHKIIGTSLVATLFSIPITIMNSFEINLLGIFNNLIFVPLVSCVVYPLCLLAFVFKPLEIFAKISILIVEGLSEIAGACSFLTFVIPKMSVVIIIIYYVLLIFRFKEKPKSTVSLVFFCLVVTKLLPMLNDYHMVNILDVGQGDSILIVSPHQSEVVLIDTGGTLDGSYNPSKKTITYLHSLGIEKLDYLILTHGDADHMGDALIIVENIKINRVVFNVGIYDNLENDLIRKLDEMGIEHYRGLEELKLDEFRMQFLNTREYENENDNSSVLYFDCEGYKFLLMGDAEKQREEDILSKYNLEGVDFFKVGHHGSDTSSSKEFIDKISPKYSLISVGKNNGYGHPKKSVLDNLNNSKIYRTDINGSIEIKLNKNGYKIITCPP